MLGLGLSMVGGACGWVAGRAGFFYLGLVSAAPAQRFLGTQPPYATQALIQFMGSTLGTFSPCAEALSGRGHLLLWPQDIILATMSAL